MDNYAALFGKKLAGGGVSGTDNYNELTNKPSINGTVLSGNKTAANIGLQPEINASSKLSSDLVDDSSSSQKFVSSSDIENWNSKQNAISDLAAIRSGAAAGATAVQPADMNTALAAKQDTLTFDTTPTQDSENPVKSGGIWTEQQKQETEIGVVANAGAKNDFDIENLIKSAVSENVTYSLSGYSLAASSNGRYARVSIPYKFKAGTTVFSSVVSEYSISGGTMYIRFATQSSSSGQIASEIEITNNGQYQREITVNADTDGFVIYYMNGSPNSYVNSAVFTNNMLRPAAITDPTFQPYARTNPELTALTGEDRAALVELVDGGAKNKMTFKSLRRTESNYGTSVYTEGVMFTLNADGTVTANREVASSSNAYVTLCAESNVAWVADDFCTGGYVLSGCPSGGGQNTYRLAAAKGTYAAYDAGNGVVLPSTVETSVGINIIIYGGYNVQNLTFRPMICTEAAWKISQTFQPYRPSWQEMWDAIQALQSGGNRALTMQMQPTESTEPEEQEEKKIEQEAER